MKYAYHLIPHSISNNNNAEATKGVGMANLQIIAEAVSPASQQREAGTGLRASGIELGIKRLGAA